MYSAEVIKRQDQLLGEIIGLARASEGNEDLVSDQTDQALLSGLVLAGSDDIEELQQQIQKIQEEKRKIVPDCFECAAPCGRTAAYDITLLLPSTSRIDISIQYTGADRTRTRRSGHADRCIRNRKPALCQAAHVLDLKLNGYKKEK